MPESRQPEHKKPSEAPTIIGASATETFARSNVRRGQVIGTYRLIRRLGRGAMGVVYEGVDQRLGRHVAIKLLTEHRIDSSALERFRREAQHVARLRHPNIVGVLDVGEQEGRPYLVMELIAGTTLSRALRERSFSYRAKAALLAKVARAIHHAHEQGIVHRDLKPANIMVEEVAVGGSPSTVSQEVGDGTSSSRFSSETTADREDDLGPPHVMDFGLALDASDASQLSVDGKAIGTPSYMPPEQAAGERKDVGPRSDVYSLGAILYEMITGRPPFLGDQIMQVLQAVLDEEPVRPAALAPTVPRDLETICLRCLEKERERRYASALALAEDLEAWLRGDPIAARPISTLGRMVKRIRKHPVSSGVVILSSGLLIAGTILSLWMLDRRARDAETARDEAQAAMLRASEESRARQESESAKQRLLDDRRRDWTLVFSDDFERPEIGEDWIFRGGGDPRIVDGWLRMSGGEPQIAILADGFTGDLRLEFDCRQQGEYLNDVSCFLYAIDNEFQKTIGYGYEFKFGGYTNSRNVLRRLGKPVWSRLDSPLVAGQVYHAVAERDGPKVSYRINGTEIFAWEDEEPLSGFDRNRVGLFGWMAITDWDNVRLWRRGEPRAADLMDVARRALDDRHFAAAEQLFAEIANGSADADRRRTARAGMAEARLRLDLENRAPDIAQVLRATWPDAVVKPRGRGYHVDLGTRGSTDLDALRGLPIESLEAHGLAITDLTPVAQDRLRILIIADGMVDDLACLAGLPLEELALDASPVADLAPLAGAPLRRLSLAQTQVADLAALAGMPLRQLDLSFTRVRDLAPLRSMPLDILTLYGVPLEDLEDLRGMALTQLRSSHGTITSLDPLRGMPLTHLLLNRQRISDLSPLAGMPLEQADFSDNPLGDLTPLAGLPLIGLRLDRCRISDLSPLRGMPLSTFAANGNRITTIRPIDNCPIAMMDVTGNPLTDLGGFLEGDRLPRSFAISTDLDAGILASLLALPDPGAINAARFQALAAIRAGDLDALPRTESGLAAIPLAMTHSEAVEVCRRLEVSMPSADNPTLLERIRTDSRAQTRYILPVWVDGRIEGDATVFSDGRRIPTAILRLGGMPDGQLCLGYSTARSLTSVQGETLRAALYLDLASP